MWLHEGVSWNVRGLGAPSNRILIKEFICKISSSVIFQDTKLLQVDRGMVKSLWSSKRIGWFILDSLAL